MERVATVATAVSLMVIIVTLSVVVGFKQELEELLSGAIADIVVTAPQSGGLVSGVGVERSTSLEELFDNAEVKSFSAYRAKEGVIKSDESIVGVVLKGVDTLYDMSFFREHITEGGLPRIGGEPRSKDVILSESVAQSMKVTVGERIEMLFVDEWGQMLRDRFQVAGLYATGVDIIDQGILLTDIRNVARLYEGDNNIVTGYELWMHEGVDKDDYGARLNIALADIYFEEGIDVEAFTLQRLFPHIYGWLATHDVNAVVIVVIMIVVALLNMATSLLIIVLERQRMMGELRAMGMRRRGIVTIFLVRALFIIMRGVSVGALLGVVVAAVQHYWHIIPLPTEGYMLSAVPAAMCWGWWLVAVAGVVVVTMAILTLPAMVAARISPAETMKYE